MGTTDSTYEKKELAKEEYKKKPTKRNLEKYFGAFEEHRQSSYRSANAGAGRGYASAKDYKRKNKR